VTAAGGAVLRAEGLGKAFGGFRALSNVSAEFRAGLLTSVIGPNGAGKSTFFNLLTGAFPPSEGRILLGGRDITGLPQHRFARMGIAKSFQITAVFPRLSVQENVRVAAQALVSRLDFWSHRARLRGLEERAAALLARVGLSHRARRAAGELAHGEQRALEVAMALAADPALLLLDEPTAGMSPEETRGFMDLVRALAGERTVVLVEHKMKLVMGVSDRVLVLHHGELLAEGTPAEIRADERVRRVYLGQRA
jgi:branched-chain amino acid transport system ATP-binding protein